MKRVIREAVLVILFSLVFVNHGYATHPKPLTATSYYVAVNSTEPEQDVFYWLYDKGYELGQAHLAAPGVQYSMPILMFELPWVQNGSYGVKSYSSPARFLSLWFVEQAVEWFGWGYKWGAGSDTQSYVAVIIGVSNHTAKNSVTYDHGREWALMVSRVQGWYATNVQNSGHQVHAYGGVDAEPGFSPALDARNWVSGYNSGMGRALIYFGSADGCIQSGTTGTPGNCNNGWNQEDVYWLSEGSPASCCSMPQIYSTGGGNAKSWQQISLYSYLRYGSRVNFYGPLSQKQAWDQKCAPLNPLPSECVGVNNTPDQAWTQFRDRLNTNPNTAQDIWYSSDIKWR